MTDRPSRIDPRWEPTPDDEDWSSGVRTGRGMPSPGLIFLAVAVIGSVLYMVFVISVRDSSQIPLMASGAVVLAIVFGALAAYSLRSTLRAGVEPGQGGRAMGIAILGGLAAMVAAGFAAGAIILFQIGSWKP
jgi:ABC-type arginine transport system permease subunit